MVQYIQRQPSFLEQMLGSGLQAFQQKRNQIAQAKSLGGLLGLDEEGIREFGTLDPTSQQLYIKAMAEREAIEQKDRALKQKDPALQQKQQLIDYLFGGSQAEPQQMGLQGLSQPQQNIEQPQQMGLQDVMGQTMAQPQQMGLQGLEQPAQEGRYPEKSIVAASLLDPNLARIMQAQNDAIDRRTQEGTKSTIAQQERREKVNLPAYQESISNIKKHEDENRSLGVLRDLNKSGKLPNNLGRLNVNFKTGELIIPALGNAETQRFAKTVNDFTTKAKDSYGSRVTNFELERFLMRLPTLANSEEGRQQIIEQMTTINKINTAKDKAMKDVFDEYGIENISFQQANQLAEKKLEKTVKPLIEKFNNIGKKTPKLETFSKVKKGTPMTADVMKALSKKHGKNISEAKKEAKELGYDID